MSESQVSARWQALLIALAVPTAHWLYHIWDDVPGWDKTWAFYCFRSVAGILICIALLPTFLRASGWPRVIGGAACVWMAWEDAECGVCGALRWQEVGPNLPTISQLCVDRFGNEPYIILCAAAISYLFIVAGDEWNRQKT